MADEKEKSLEMRIAALEDKLSKLMLTEEETEVLEKAARRGVNIPAPGNCVIQQCVQQCVQQCIIQQCIQACYRQQCIRFQCIRQQCVECSCGPCIISGGTGTGVSGFGDLG
jgi:hypothetical protein